MNLFQQAEQGFDKLFDYKRQLVESFDYCNTMKNGTIFERLNLQGQELQSNDKKQQSIKIAIKKTYFLSSLKARK